MTIKHPSSNRQANPGGRPKKYASAAERQAAFRERYPTINVRTEPHIKGTVRKIAEEFDVSEAEVINSLIKFALTNRNWQSQGLWGKKLPHAGAKQVPTKTTKTNPARKSASKPARPELPYVLAALHGKTWRVIGHAATMEGARTMGEAYANKHLCRVAVHDHLSPYHVGRSQKI